MLPYIKARKLAEIWIELTTDGSCEISSVEDKPYGWVFYYNAKNHDQDDFSTYVVGNAPIIIDRVDCEIRVTGTAHPIDHYLKEYEATLPKARLQMTPEMHDGVKKHK